MDNNDDTQNERFGQERQTTYGMTSEQYQKIDQIVQNLVQKEKITFQMLIQAIELNINIRSQTQLIELIFKHYQIVKDLILFPLQPLKMMKKYKLSLNETLKYISLIALFLKQNDDFYQSYFLMLQQNSILQAQEGSTKDSIVLTRKNTNKNAPNIQLWFSFLWETQENNNQFRTSLGYFSQIFLPFVKFYNNLSSNVNILPNRSNNFTKLNVGIWLITHFYPEVIDRIVQYSYHEPIFQCMFTLVRVSIDQQEWRLSLYLLQKLCDSVIIDGTMSDRHIEFVCKKVKEVKENISKDKNGTVFAFLQGIIKSKLVDASLRRLQLFTQKSEQQDDYIISLNIKFLDEMVDTYKILLKKGIKKTTQKVQQLREQLLKISKKIPIIFTLIQKYQSHKIHLSNGQNIRSTPLFIFNFLKMLKHFLIYTKNYGENDQELNVCVYVDKILELLQIILTRNRWNSIVHCQIQKIIGMIITTQLFKSKKQCLRSFLSFLIQSFANKKYVFLNSTRMINQGDLSFLYHVSCKITKRYEGAAKHSGISGEFSKWQKFVVNVLKNYEVKSEKSKYSTQSEQLLEYNEVLQSTQNVEKIQGFSGYIDQADQMASIKRTIDKIDIFQKWKNRNAKKAQMHRSGSLLPLSDIRATSNDPRNSNKSPYTTYRNRGSVPVNKKMNKSDLFPKNIKKQPSFQFSQTQIPKQLAMERIQSVQKHQKSSSEDQKAQSKRFNSDKVASYLKIRQKESKN